jgi:hypothetical protein
LAEFRHTQAQLIQKRKMAFGWAYSRYFIYEIQKKSIKFREQFSSENTELISELQEERKETAI